MHGVPTWFPTPAPHSAPDGHRPHVLWCGASRQDAERRRVAVHSQRCPRPQDGGAPETAGMHPLLRSAADRQLGLVTATDARRAGYDQAEVRRLCASGAWVALRRGVYVAADTLAGAEAQGGRHALDCLAVLLSLGRPSAVLSHASAARLWGLPVRRGLPATVRLTDPTQWRRGRGYLVSQAALSEDEVTRRGPLPLTTPTRTLVDCAREWPAEDAVVAMDAALLAGRTTTEDLAHAAAAAHHRPGAAQAVRAVALTDGRAESPLETRGRLRIIGSGLPAPQLQVEIRAGGRLVGVVDAWFADAAVAVEFDGQVKYTDPWREPGRVLWEEKRREDDLRALGIRFVRLADADLGDRWTTVGRRLARMLGEPGPARREFTAVPRARGLLRTG
jgi:predicted transcriptional regulator of viral defense system